MLRSNRHTIREDISFATLDHYFGILCVCLRTSVSSPLLRCVCFFRNSPRCRLDEIPHARTRQPRPSSRCTPTCSPAYLRRASPNAPRGGTRIRIWRWGRWPARTGARESSWRPWRRWASCSKKPTRPRRRSRRPWETCRPRGRVAEQVVLQGWVEVDDDDGLRQKGSMAVGKSCF